MPSFPSHATASVLYVLEIIDPDNVHLCPISTSGQSPGSVKQPLGDPYNLECPFWSSRKESCNTLSHNLGIFYNAPIFEGMAPSSFISGQVSGICPCNAFFTSHQVPNKMLLLPLQFSPSGGLLHS